MKSTTKPLPWSLRQKLVHALRDDLIRHAKSANLGEVLAGVIEPRVEEIFALVHQVMRDSGFEEVLSSGIVLAKRAMPFESVEAFSEKLLVPVIPWHFILMVNSTSAAAIGFPSCPCNRIATGLPDFNGRSSCLTG